ncbi:unnamed protein product [Moneuplotes crassus]|uniref:Uncharacterized protein n=1 Tax=Euplotes crassus TaxID=5936 RepID=A0AAD2D3Y0_EUPCR|nr:unnamed protein product [Moneuplotes crassus]
MGNEESTPVTHRKAPVEPKKSASKIVEVKAPARTLNSNRLRPEYGSMDQKMPKTNQYKSFKKYDAIEGGGYRSERKEKEESHVKRVEQEYCKVGRSGVEDFKEEENVSELYKMSKNQLVSRITKMQRKIHMSEGGSNYGSEAKKRIRPNNHQADISSNNPIIRHSKKRGTKGSINSDGNCRTIKRRFGKRMLGSDQSSQKQSAGGTSFRSGKINIFGKKPTENKKANLFKPNSTAGAMEYFRQKEKERVVSMKYSENQEKPKAKLPKFQRLAAYKSKPKNKTILFKKKETLKHEEQKYAKPEQEPEESHDSQTGNSFRESAVHNSSFITFGRASEGREEVGEIKKYHAEQG